MKNIYKIFGSIFIMFLMVGCDEDFSDNNEFARNIVPPSNVTAAFDITQDNTGNVTITPTAEQAISFTIDYGDGSDISPEIKTGGSVQHTFKEGSYTLKVTAKGLNNLTTTADVSLVVSFKAPENLQVSIENDTNKSKQVNVTATADYATVFDFISGEDGAEKVTANIGETASFTYKEPGIYSVKVVARGAAIATTEWTMDFEVTAILAPTVSAPAPPDRASSTVISIFSDAYTNVSNVNMNPNWGQSGQGSGYNVLDINGDKITHYSKLSYQGVEYDQTDMTSMEFLHIDAWTADLNQLKTFLIRKPDNANPREGAVSKELTKDSWTSLDIPLTEWTSQGITLGDLFQFKFEGVDQWAKADVFLDNIYFWKNNPVGLPVNFDKEEPFKGVGGASFELSTDPEDSSNKTGKITNGGNDWETAELTLDEPIKVVSGGDNNYSVRIYNPTADTHELMMKLEQSGNNEYIEIKQNFSAKGWNVLTFDLSTITAQAWPNPGAAWDGTADFKKLVFFIDGGKKDTGTYHIDDIVKGTGSSFPASIPINFEENVNFKGVGGATFEMSKDPTNSSNGVGKVVNGGNDWETAELMMTTPIQIRSGQQNFFSVDIHSPNSDTHELMMKLEQSSDNEYIELKASFSKEGWNTVTFDFSSVTAQAWPNPGAAWDGNADFKKLVFFIDGGKKDTGTYYLDNIITRNKVSLPIDFSTKIPFNGVGGASTSLPFIDPTDSSNYVMQVINGGQDWETAELILDEPIKVVSGADNRYSVRIHNATSDTHELMMKLEQSGNNEYIELKQNFSAQGWTTLTFDFSTVSSQAWPNPGAAWDGTADFKKLVFFIDGGKKDTGTYYIDDIKKVN